MSFGSKIWGDVFGAPGSTGLSGSDAETSTSHVQDAAAYKRLVEQQVSAAQSQMMNEYTRGGYDHYDPVTRQISPPSAPKSESVFDSENTMRRMIADRLHISPHANIPAKQVNVVAMDDMVVVFVALKSGKHVTFEDDKGLFPSDTLITQLRMVL